MQSIIEQSKAEWDVFFERIISVRRELRCLKSNAWFRGHRESSWDLRPGIIRSYASTINEKTESSDHDLRRKVSNASLRLAGITDYEFLRISTNQRIELEKLNEEALRTKGEIKRTQRLRSEMRYILAQRRLSASGQETEISTALLASLCAKANLRLVPRSEVGSALQSLVDTEIDQYLAQLSIEEGRLSKTLAKAISDIGAVIAATFGEQDSFVDFRSRFAMQSAGSWEVLATMQHYGVETRLLDWTESLLVSLSFALSAYIRLQESTIVETGGSLDEFLSKALAADLPEPAIWVLNPYYLARKTTIGNKIVDLSLSKNLDYYEKFFVERCWPYTTPIPTYGPRRDERMSWQYSTFTVHGTDLRSLEKQVGDAAVRKLPLSRAAAAYGARLLFNLAPLDKFSLFRDLDSLGETIKNKYKPWGRNEHSVGLKSNAPLEERPRAGAKRTF